MNCDHHRQKMRQFLDDYNKCVAENIKLKDANSKLNLKNQTLVKKLSISLDQNTILK